MSGSDGAVTWYTVAPAYQTSPAGPVYQPTKAHPTITNPPTHCYSSTKSALESRTWTYRVGRSTAEPYPRGGDNIPSPGKAKI